MKFRFYHYFIAIICIVVCIIICGIIYNIWYEFYGSGIVGTSNSISNIPHANKDFNGLNAKGPYTYCYKMVPRKIGYIFTGKISENNLRKFCTTDKGWEVKPLSLAVYTCSFVDFNVDTSKILNVIPNIPKEPNENNTDINDLYACRKIPPKEKGDTGVLMHIYFLKNEEMFVVYVSRGYRNEDWN